MYVNKLLIGYHQEVQVYVVNLESRVALVTEEMSVKGDHPLLLALSMNVSTTNLHVEIKKFVLTMNYFIHVIVLQDTNGYGVTAQVCTVFFTQHNKPQSIFNSSINCHAVRPNFV